ncbi:MAG TPA: hypothetical protein VFK54_07355 [Candidatus Limnocylindrales bacterium]|nr:hypothetical protein [Candidatus Limnocylindrales bacterium]
MADPASPAPRFERLRPVADDYASRPIAAAFNWSDVADPGTSGEWYLVVFRSIRRPEADERLLTEYDERAHREAESSEGFVHYFKGPLSPDRSCLSFCLWSSRVAARAAAGRTAHREAVTLVAEMYERYTLEFYRVAKRRGAAAFRIEPYDTPAVAA